MSTASLLVGSRPSVSLDGRRQTVASEGILTNRRILHTTSTERHRKIHWIRHTAVLFGSGPVQ